MTGSAYLLTLSCPNQPGIVARVTTEIFSHGGNIMEAHQFDDTETGSFFTRIVFSLPEGQDPAQLLNDFAPIAEQFGMEWSMRPRDERRKVLLLASKFDHCLIDLLYRCRIGELRMDVVGIISNHPLATYSEIGFGAIPFHYLPVTKDTKAQQEQQIKEIVTATGADLVVLARYMQILSDDLATFLAGRCINIHHSFLPAFVGADPYRRAHERGVKMIGATAHYVTAELDAGPIIAQDTARVSHRDTVEELRRRGAELERRVLADAVRLGRLDLSALDR